MTVYSAPVKDMMFLFEHLKDNKNYNEIEKYKEVTSDLVKDILEEAAKINEEMLLPLAKTGDENPCVYENGVVRTPPGYKEAYSKFIEDGWVSLTCDPKYGVNGVGKTTTIGKLGKIFIQNSNKVLFSACDTFRAAAIDQLEEWANRVDAKIVKSDPGSDPASVAFKAMEIAQSQNIDQVIVDTAGRLQNKKNLMDELKKIGNVIKKNDETAPHEVILVLDATSGQNIINQLEEFNKLLPITGIIMTKLDGTAKGGILIAISKKYKVPIVGLGLGEKEDDLQIFEAEKFANAFTQVN